MISIISFFCYFSSILFQYVFIDIFPTKWIATVGVSRFATFGYWILLILWMIMTADFLKEKRAGFLQIVVVKPKVITLFLCNIIIVGLLFLDNPKADRMLKREKMYDFVKTTSIESVFMTFSNQLNLDMRIVGNRSIFISKEFPFSESKIEEFGDRYSKMFGSIKTQKIGISYYRALTPENFVKIAQKHQLDYVIIERKFSTAFQNYLPSWKDNKVLIFAINDFK